MAQVPSDVVKRLYSAHPDGFVSARKEAAAAVGAAGDAAGAREIAKLPKPTVAAWLVNLLAWRRPDLVAELAELSAQLRAAQRELRGAQLRELSARRRAAVAGLVAEARALAARERPEVAAAKLPLAEVEATLTAALADEEVAALVRTGRLVRPVAYTGFGEVPRPQLRLLAGGAEQAEPGERRTERREADERAARTRREADERADSARRAAARRELSAARTAARKAEAALERATTAESDAAQALAAVEAELAELGRRRAAAEEELGRRKLARKSAQRAVVAARRHTGEAEAAVEALTSKTIRARPGG